MLADPRDQRPATARQHLKTPAAVRSAQQRAFDAEDVEGQAAVGSVGNNCSGCQRFLRYC